MDYVGQVVKKGQPLFTLYSSRPGGHAGGVPDLRSGDEAYLGSSPFQGGVRRRQLARAGLSRTRLKLWDISGRANQEAG